MSAVLVVVIPNLRVMQNFAYLFFAYTGLWDWPLFFLDGGKGATVTVILQFITDNL